jgi:hypothetical protein
VAAAGKKVTSAGQSAPASATKTDRADHRQSAVTRPGAEILSPLFVTFSYWQLTPCKVLAAGTPGHVLPAGDSSTKHERIDMPLPETAEPARLSRRSMLRGAAGAGAAGLAMTALASPALASPALASQRGHATPEAEHVPDHVADGEAVVVHVRDVRSGEMDVYRGTGHVRLQDRALAARLARASQ